MATKKYTGNVHLRDKDSEVRFPEPACRTVMSYDTPKEAFTTDPKKVTCGNCTRTGQFKTSASTLRATARSGRGSRL